MRVGGRRSIVDGGGEVSEGGCGIVVGGGSEGSFGLVIRWWNVDLVCKRLEIGDVVDMK